jgi:hypothetical protein
MSQQVFLVLLAKNKPIVGEAVVHSVGDRYLKVLELAHGLEGEVYFADLGVPVRYDERSETAEIMWGKGAASQKVGVFDKVTLVITKKPNRIPIELSYRIVAPGTEMPEGLVVRSDTKTFNE